MHAVLFDGGVLQVKNGSVVKARETFTMAGIGTFEVKDFKSVSFADHWALTVILRPLSIQNPKAIFHVDGGEWHELGSAFVTSYGITTTLKHQKSAN